MPQLQNKGEHTNINVLMFVIIARKIIAWPYGNSRKFDHKLFWYQGQYICRTWTLLKHWPLIRSENNNNKKIGCAHWLRLCWQALFFFEISGLINGQNLEIIQIPGSWSLESLIMVNFENLRTVPLAYVGVCLLPNSYITPSHTPQCPMSSVLIVM